MSITEPYFEDFDISNIPPHISDTEVRLACQASYDLHVGFNQFKVLAHNWAHFYENRDSFGERACDLAYTPLSVLTFTFINKCQILNYFREKLQLQFKPCRICSDCAPHWIAATHHIDVHRLQNIAQAAILAHDTVDLQQARPFLPEPYLYDFEELTNNVAFSEHIPFARQAVRDLALTRRLLRVLAEYVIYLDESQDSFGPIPFHRILDCISAITQYQSGNCDRVQNLCAQVGWPPKPCRACPTCFPAWLQATQPQPLSDGEPLAVLIQNITSFTSSATPASSGDA